jgi:nucleotide-binding universal stress UspA family protein
VLEIKKILLATELGRNSERALEYAKMFTSQFQAELHVLHVLEDVPSNTPIFGGGLALTSFVHESAQVVEQKIQSLFEPAWRLGKQIVTATAEGAPGAQILGYAVEHKIDLIVLGTHGRTGLTHILVGSVAEQVTRQSKCPVVVVRSLADAA